MGNIERAPFSANWEKLPCLINKNIKTADSVVGKITTPEGLEWVIKWARRRIYQPEEGWAICQYLARSYKLYQKALGEEFIVSSQFILGEKMNGRGLEYKPYIVQPFIISWTAKDAPQKIKQNQEIVRQWRTLYCRLSRLYITARKINNKFTNPQNRFPITITVGPTRKLAFNQGNFILPQKLPPTPNILITKEAAPRILLPDFGRYLSWQEEMKDAYSQILKSSSL